MSNEEPDDKKKSPENTYLKTERGEEIMHIMQKGAEFTHELIKENERLRFRNAQVEEINKTLEMSVAGGVGTDEINKLLKKLSSIEDEKEKLLEKYKAVEEENKDFANRYLEIEAENNNLANLYVASYQLHSTLNFNEVLRIILEIIINLIGAEDFAIMMLDEKTHKLSAVATEGIDQKDVPVSVQGEGIVGKAAKSGENYFADPLPPGGTPVDLNKPLVCIPMKIKERVIGTIVIYKLLQQKEAFNKLDYELFTLLAGHTATAIFSSKLYSESERKLSTIQGFIDLLTKQPQK
ncbi:MAG: GAF domain-containing protein [Deltaproteobacteria bacterium]|nr:GAF domain-containing protein [Deltaproteobacteria bacterium]